MRKILAMSLLLVSVAAPCAGLTLEAAIDMAVKDNPTLAGAMRQWEAAKLEKTLVSSLPDPMLELGFGSSGSDFEGTMQMIGVSQKIPFPAKILKARSRADRLSLAAEAAYESRMRQIVKQVKSAYMDLVLLEETVRIYEANLTDAELLEEAIRRRYEVGRASQHDLVKMQIEVLLLEDQMRVLRENDLVNAGAALRQLLGLDQTDALGDPEGPDIDVAGIRTDEIRRYPVDQSPELAMHGYRLDAARQDLGLARMDWIPDLNLRLFREEMDMVMGRNKRRGIALGINVPIWAWRTTAKTGAKRTMLAKADSDLEAATDGLGASLEQAIASFESARKSFDLFEHSVIPEAELALASAMTAYETGKIDVLSLLSAQRSLRDLRLSRLRLWTRLAKDLAEIERITGRRLY
jgi:cobalt-zinc-cadmium efflux system outer membrane protein